MTTTELKRLIRDVRDANGTTAVEDAPFYRNVIALCDEMEKRLEGDAASALLVSIIEDGNEVRFRAKGKSGAYTITIQPARNGNIEGIEADCDPLSCCNAGVTENLRRAWNTYADM